MDGSTAYQYGYGKGAKRVKTGKKTMAGIARKLETTGHKVTDLSKQGVKSKDDLKAQCATDRVRVGQSIGGKPFIFGNNYVLFSQEAKQTLILKEPPIIAHAEPPRSEEWKRDRMTRAIWAKTFGELRKHKPTCLRTLRLNNKTQHPHSPPARWKVDDDSADQWRKEMIAFLLSEGLGRT